jgi:hypothetical protein
LETAATLTRGIKPYDKVSSLRGSNTLLWEQQNKIRRQNTQKRGHGREIKTQIREDQIKEDPRTRTEEPGPRRDAKSKGQSTS